MAFNTSISGLQAAQKDMGVISNNIANVSTTGFKRSDSLFAELYTATLGGAGTQPGSGVTLERIRSDFSQGSFEFTSSQLDLAIDGNGLFVLQNGAETLFTRAGAFRLDNDGFVVTESGATLQGYGADANGQINTALGDLQITNALLAQKPTEEITFNGNLDSRATTPATVPFDATNPETYNFTSTTTVYDSAGAAHQVTMYFAKDATVASQYNVSVSVDDVVQPETASLLFDNAGVLDATSVTALNLASYAPANANAQAININFATITGYGATSATSGVTQDGYAAGQLAGFEFDRTGIAYATYTNGETRAVGQVALATFTNPSGLQSAGKTNFAESSTSGVASIGTPDSGARGGIRPSALESANVDLTVELLALIEAQRNFQSNAQAIQNENDASQAILQLR
ncbi:flagellar hook protein FlgE [Luminiphilus sp.]|nr:flagellar hook protein FlgE [Luminiphilus sp.]MDB2317024.1 flagellar hook protein FlgE [Luminiphilus sp.]